MHGFADKIRRGGALEGLKSDATHMYQKNCILRPPPSLRRQRLPLGN